MTLRIGEKQKKIDLELTKKKHRQSIKNVKAIPGEFQHAIVVVYIDNKKIRNVLRKTCTWRRMTSLLKDVKIRKRFEAAKALKTDRKEVEGGRYERKIWKAVFQ